MTGPRPRIRVDFQNADEDGRVRLNTLAAMADVSAQQLQLTDGLTLALVDAELSATGVVRWSDGEHLWVAEVTSEVVDAETA